MVSAVSQGAKVSQVNDMNRPDLVFATFAGNSTQLHHALILCQSLREYGGRYSNSAFLVYLPVELMNGDTALIVRFQELGAALRTCEAFVETVRYYYARKVYAAAQCETENVSKRRFIVWLDEDTIILQEPTEIELIEEIWQLGWRPVMHKNIGSIFSEPPDPFWLRVYALLDISDSSVFPMKTAASEEVVRPYINAGLLVVRPEAGLLRQWKNSFELLSSDSLIQEFTNADPRLKIFLHQAALAGALLTTLSKDEIYQLPDSYNYPLFFKQMYGAPREFNDLESVVTLRYDVFFENPTPEWWLNVKGDSTKISWIREKFQ